MKFLIEDIQDNRDRIYEIRVKTPDGNILDLKVLGYDYESDVKDTVKKHLGKDVIFNSANPTDFYSVVEFIKRNYPEDIMF